MVAAAAIFAASGLAFAEGESAKDMAKKTEQGFGRLLQGIGQAAKKAGEAVSATVKKDDKKAKPKPAGQDGAK
jgi:hypothetical protein